MANQMRCHGGGVRLAALLKWRPKEPVRMPIDGTLQRRFDIWQLLNPQEKKRKSGIVEEGWG